jgi:hypothetical protein
MVPWHIGLSQGQAAFEEALIEAGNRAGDLGLMLVHESFHGVLLCMAAETLPWSGKNAVS